MLINVQNLKFDIDLDKTAHYYEAHSLCECAGCRNFRAQAKELYPNLAQFLNSFGADIAKPDELAWVCADKDKIDCSAVWYTVNGKIFSDAPCEFFVADRTELTVTAEKDVYVPNEQENDDYFVLTVCGVSLPNKLNIPLD